jgi:hypothetical protein
VSRSTSRRCVYCTDAPIRQHHRRLVHTFVHPFSDSAPSLIFLTATISDQDILELSQEDLAEVDEIEVQLNEASRSGNRRTMRVLLAQKEFYLPVPDTPTEPVLIVDSGLL